MFVTFNLGLQVVLGFSGCVRLGSLVSRPWGFRLFRVWGIVGLSGCRSRALGSSRTPRV